MRKRQKKMAGVTEERVVVCADDPRVQNGEDMTVPTLIVRIVVEILRELLAPVSVSSFKYTEGAFPETSHGRWTGFCLTKAALP